MQQMTDAKILTAELGGHWYGSYGLCLCPAHSDRNPSLSLKNGADGRLLMHCHAGCNFPDILEALNGLELIDGHGNTPTLDPEVLARREAQEQAAADKKSRQAEALWKQAESIQGTLGEAYLRARGITCSLPGTLRFHPAAWHPSAKRFPAIIALVQGGNGFAVHRTYLAANQAVKAEVVPNKAMLGSVKGGAVRLSRSAGDLVVAEGIETALSLSSGLITSSCTLWAALSTSGLKCLHLPSTPNRLTIAMDGDRAGREAGNVLAQRAVALGWIVSLLPAPEGRDWNDMLCERGAKL
jgi:phage/plasmid primase-like uncharacterized protein